MSTDTVGTVNLQKTFAKMAEEKILPKTHILNNNISKIESKINYFEENLEKARVCLDCSEKRLAGTDQNCNEVIKKINKKAVTEIQEFFNGKNILVTGATGKRILFFF